MLRYGAGGGRISYHDGTTRDLGPTSVGPFLRELGDAEAATIRQVEIFAPVDQVSDFESDPLRLSSARLDLRPFERQEGEVLLRTIWLSLDPYMRGRMSNAASNATPVPVGGVMEAGTVNEVIASNNPGFAKGDIVLARAGWQSHALSDGKGLHKIDPKLGPVSTAVGVLGMPGMTAYTGLLDIGKPQPGETVVVAAASGAVGSLVGQIARIKGCRVIGIAGGERKCRYVKEELGFDACLDHHQPDLPERLPQPAQRFRRVEETKRCVGHPIEPLAPNDKAQQPGPPRNL